MVLLGTSKFAGPVNHNNDDNNNIQQSYKHTD